MALLARYVVALATATLIAAFESACAREGARSGDRGPPARSVETPFDRTGKPAEKITLTVRDADIRDFARRLSELTGVPIMVAASVSGRITMDVKDVPWDEALASAIAPLGLRYDVLEQGIFISHASDRYRVIPGETPGYYRVGGDVKPPKILKFVHPAYPEEAKAARLSGVVVVEALIGEDGSVRGAKVLKGLSLALDGAALEAVRQWVFAPGTLDGKPVPVVFNVIVSFKLGEKELSPAQ